MTGHQSTVPPVAAVYFRERRTPIDTYYDHPLIAATFRPGVGWKRYGSRKRVSISACRKLRAEGVTHVQLSAGGHLVDFTAKELTR